MTTVEEISVIIQNLDTLMAAYDFRAIDDRLAGVDVTRDPASVIAHIRCTFCVRSKLTEWENLLNRYNTQNIPHKRYLLGLV